MGLPNETSRDQKPGTNPTRSQRPAQLWGRGGRGGPRLRHPGDIHGDNSRSSVGSGRIIRPPRKRQDKALFVPKGIRKKANWRERESPGGENCPKNAMGKDGGRQQEAEEEEDAGKSSAEHPGCDEKVPPLGNSQRCCGQENRDRDCSHSHERHPQGESSPANTVTAEFQRQENQPSQNSRGSECGESSSPLENHSWPQLAAAESPQLENQSLESSRNKSSPAHLDPSNAALSFSKLENQEQVEQKPLGNVLEGPGGALAAPGDDPEQIQHRKEEEEDKEHSDVAEALGRSLDLAAGDREGTSLEGDCTAELLAEVIGGKKNGKNPSPGGNSMPWVVQEGLEWSSESGFQIQWVDETHALGIFSSLST
ncbi:hypothetical protein IHE44_0010473, partial [Lamprotornis superbus]